MYLCPRLIACTNTFFFFTLTGLYPSHAFSVTGSLRTYFTSVRRVFLVETVVLQTVLWDIRAWSARFLGNRLRCGHTFLRHGHLMDNEVQEPPRGCSLCLRVWLSVEQIMIDYPQLATRRRRHLSGFRRIRNLTMNYILGKERKVKEVITYFKAIGAYDAV